MNAVLSSPVTPTQPLTVAANRRTDHLRHAVGTLVSSLLAQKDVTDVYLNPPEQVGLRGEVWVVRHGEDPTVCGTMAGDEAMRLVTAVAGTLDTTITKDRPFVEGELFGDGPRFEGLIPPVVLGPCWAIRNPASRVYTLAEYEARGDIAARQRAILEDAIVRRLNIVAVGGTGSGKTTFLNALAEGVARLTPAHRMLTIEGARELRIASRNKVQFRTAPGFDEHMALRAGLRLNIDRVWVGEVRGAEVLRMLDAWNTGHDGGACSLHSNTATPGDALLRIEQMAALATSAPLQKLIARLVNLIVCLKRDAHGRRRVTQIVRVVGWDGADYVLETEH